MLKIYVTPYQLFLSVALATLLVAAKPNQSLAQQGSNKNKSDFTAKLMNLEAATNEVFRYSTSLTNGAGQSKIYELKANVPLGWSVTFRVDGNQVTSVNVAPGKTQEVGIEITPTTTADPKKYLIPIQSISQTDTLKLQLEAVIKGSYGLVLSTPSGRLSEEVTAGNQQQIQLFVKNSGTLPLTGVSLSSQLPTGWELNFDQSQIQELAPGKELTLQATLKVPEKTIAGDYAATLTANSSHSNAQAAFRFIVKTSLLSGWIGMVVILLAITLIVVLIRKYGRR
jgi:uncharacterized membrane protein